MKFRHTWRPYQARVINAVHEHLDDKRLHVVAAPGAGKTTLGLEIFRLLGKPTLVLSP
ncbi:TPA: DEAD/DEAH box helicase family protein, partial [Vibrio campbellii]|nr:DEAD/DEAH box helicase family protein [Vibrio campbellii]